MTDPAIRARLHAILAEQAMIDLGQVTDAASPQDLGIDSMGLVETIFAIEEAFDITVPFNANAPDQSEFDISTVGAIGEAVERLIAQQHA